jgi:hypothetical protein
MVRVIDPERLLDILAKRIELNALRIGLLPQSELCDGVFMSWDGKAAKAQLKSAINGYATTARLLGVRRISFQGINTILDLPISFNIPLLDQI